MRQAIEIDVARCKPSPTARPIKEGQVLVLMESIKSIGLRQPINVRPRGEDYEIRGGGHRHAAFQRLGYSTIPAFVCDDDDLHAELAEIDENLIRNELSPAERAMAIARRKAIYEALHPEAAVGATGKGRAKVRQVGEAKPPAERFTKATADATGTSERAVQRDAARGETLGPDVLARVVGTSLDKGEQIDALAKLTPEKRDEVIGKAVAGQKSNAVAAVKAEVRDAKERDLGAKTLALPNAKFNVIYADPPWRFEPYSRETGMDRAPENHYPTETTGSIVDMKVGDIAADDCVLFLWATVPMLPDALAVMAAWGFTYKSHCIWNKDWVGTGYWFRNKHELLLIGTKGSIPAPLPGTQAISVIDAPVKDHSRKPVIFRSMIEGLFPNLPKVELFCRTPAPGWHMWGKEAPAAAPSEVEQDLDGKDIIPQSKAEKRDTKLMADALADIEGEEIPAFLRRVAV